MAEPEQTAAALDEMVGAGLLVGYVCGVRHDGRSRIIAGGRRSIDGLALPPDAVFPLSSNTKPVGGVLAMRLVELGVLDLDTPVGEFLPELARPRVLAEPGGPLDRTVEAEAPVTLRHLLTMTAGLGWVAELGPLPEAMAAQQVAPGPYAPPMPSGEYLRRLGELPLADHPGRSWFYHTSSDVLGVLLARATGATVGDLLSEHLTGPLGLEDLGFTAAASRMPTSYGLGETGDRLDLHVASRFAEVPEFESLACGLAASLGAYLEFLDVLIDGGSVLAPETAHEMSRDHLTARQRDMAQGFVAPGCGYGFQVETRPGGIVGWGGGLGTVAYTDRRAGRSAAVFVTQNHEVPGTAEALDLVWSLLE